MTKRFRHRGPRRMAIPALLLAFGLSTCGDSSTGLPPVLEITEVDFAASLEINLAEFTASSTGVHVKTETEGQGNPAGTGVRVDVHYWGWLPNGHLFDSSEGRQPLNFVLGSQGVIPGFQEGVMGMRRGGSRVILIPPHMAYGAAGAGSGTIPPNSWLVFRVQLVSDVN